MDKIIYKEIEKFDIEFPDKRGIFEGGDLYGARRKAIKNWMIQYTKIILEAQNEKLRKLDLNTYTAEDIIRENLNLIDDITN